MVKVRRERPSQRLHHRVNAPILVEMPLGIFEAQDWSLGGFRVKCGKTECQVGEVLSVGLQISFQGFEIGFQVDAEVCRIFEDSGEIACSFKDIGERETEILEHFVEELVRGSVTVVDDTLLRIDTPVTPVSTKPDPNPVEEVPVRRWPFKQIALVGFYFCAGLMVVGYAYSVFVANFLRLEVASAVVTAPIEPIISTADGKIQRIVANAGEMLPTNTAIFVIENAKVEERIEMAKIKVERETMELVARQKRLKAEQAKTIDYRTMHLTELEQASARVRALERQMTLSEKQVIRVERLQQEGWATRTKVEKVKAEYAVLKGKFEEALAEKRKSQAFMQSAKEGRVVDGSKIDSRLTDLTADVDLAWDRIMLAKDELMALQRHKERLTLAAPSNGRVIKVFKGRGSSVKSGESIGLFERAEARRIKAYLTQKEILQIGLGDEALVFFPALGQSVRTVVVDIDRTSGFVNERMASYEWSEGNERNGQVTLEFLDLPLNEIRHRFLPGMPAIVNFKRRDSSLIPFSRPSQPPVPPDTPSQNKGFGV